MNVEEQWKRLEQQVSFSGDHLLIAMASIILLSSLVIVFPVNVCLTAYYG